MNNRQRNGIGKLVRELNEIKDRVFSVRKTVQEEALLQAKTGEADMLFQAEILLTQARELLKAAAGREPEFQQQMDWANHAFVNAAGRGGRCE